MESVPVLDFHRINTEERDAVQEQAHSFSMVFFVLTDFQDTLQQRLQNGQAVVPWRSVCSEVVQGVMRLCSGSLWPHSLWREVPGCSVVTPMGEICCLGLFSH